MVALAERVALVETNNDVAQRTSVQLYPDQLAALDRIARARGRGVKRAAVIRAAVDAFIAAHDRRPETDNAAA